MMQEDRHFAHSTPGIREPALVLSYDGEDEGRMMLTLSEILQLKLRSEMVVLSACNTGSGRVTRAEGVASLGTAFLAAGAVPRQNLMHLKLKQCNIVTFHW